MKECLSAPRTLLSRDESLLVVIDMQERLLPVIAEKQWIVENVLTLVKSARVIGLPILLTEQQNLRETIPELREELKGIQPIIKLEFDCFTSHPFVEQIRQLNRNTLIIIGVEAHICVAQTALHALSHYAVHVVSDAISSRSLHNWEVAIERMRHDGVTITSTEMVIYELLGKAGTDQFRETLKLVK
jgi:nicotinamidase-related amidase